MTEQAATTPEWMTPGTEVIISSGGSMGSSLTKTTIEKVTKAHIVVQGGAKFRRTGLSKVGASTWDTSKLLDPSHPSTEIVWLSYQQKQLRSNLQYEVEELLKEFGRTGDVALAEQARDKTAEAISRFKAREAQIAKLTAAAKQG